MIRKGILLVLTVSTLALLALILHIRLTQRPSDESPVKLSTDGFLITEIGDKAFVTLLLDDILTVGWYAPKDVPRWDQILRSTQANLAGLSAGERRFQGARHRFAAEIKPFLWIAFPLWVPCLLLAIYPALALIRPPYRRYRRRKRGLCLKCGYSLEGNVSGVCPECGETI